MALKARSGGVRRFQNEDGTLTEAGKKRYSTTSDTRRETNKHSDDRIRKEIDRYSWQELDPESISPEEFNKITETPAFKKAANIALAKYEGFEDGWGDNARAQKGWENAYEYRKNNESPYNHGDRVRTEASTKVMQRTGLNPNTDFHKWYDAFYSSPEYEKYKRLTAKYREKYNSGLGSAMLKDLGYNDTKFAREYVTSIFYD